MTSTNNSANLINAASGVTLPGAWLATRNGAGLSVVTFDNLFTSTYSVYQVFMNDLLPSNNGVSFRMRVGTGATPTYQTANYSGNALCYSTNYSSGTGAIDLVSPTNFGSSSTGLGYVIIGNTQHASHNKEFVSQVSYWNSSTNHDDIAIGAMNWQAGTVVTSVEFYVDAGTFTSGEFRLYALTN